MATKIHLSRLSFYYDITIISVLFSMIATISEEIKSESSLSTAITTGLNTETIETETAEDKLMETTGMSIFKFSS